MGMNDLRYSLFAPAALEADQILSSYNPASPPGWMGNISLQRDAQRIEIHDYRRPFSMFDVWNWGSSHSTVINHHYHYATPEKKEKKEEEKHYFFRTIVFGVAAVVLYFTSQSLAYAAGQFSSASHKIEQLHQVKAEFSPEAAQVKEHREYFLAQAKRKNMIDVAGYVGIVSGLVILGSAAIVGSGALGVFGGVVAVVSLIAKQAFHAFEEGKTDEAEQKRRAQEMKDLATRLYSQVEVLEEDDATYPDLSLFCASAPPL